MLILEILEEVVVSLVLMFFAATLSVMLFKIKNYAFSGTTAQKGESNYPILTNVHCYGFSN
ncbi:MAG: hypothetical protein ACTSUO_02865 [Candidatus Thorarchaeota archaeon]